MDELIYILNYSLKIPCQAEFVKAVPGAHLMNHDEYDEANSDDDADADADDADYKIGDDRKPWPTRSSEAPSDPVQTWCAGPASRSTIIVIELSGPDHHRNEREHYDNNDGGVKPLGLNIIIKPSKSISP